MNNPCIDCLVYPICLQRYLNSVSRDYTFTQIMIDCKLCYNYMNFHLQSKLGKEYHIVTLTFGAFHLEFLNVPFHQDHITPTDFYRRVAVRYARTL